MFVLSNMWFQSLMRTFFFNVDKLVYNCISTIYDLLISIARTSVLSQADIIDMADRVYKLLAVFMIFKVTFSLIMYVVNPDEFSDKNKGVGKLGVNIVITLALLVLTPYAFNYAYQFQTIILEDNSMAALIFGEETGDVSQSAFSSAGDKMAYVAMSPFFIPDSASNNLYDCANLTVKDGEKVRFNENCSGIKNDELENNNIVEYIPTSNENVGGTNAATLYKLTKDKDDNKKDNKRFSDTTLANYVAGINSQNLGLMFRQDMALATDSENESFIMNYSYILSTVVGIVILLLLVTFCMDVALRSLKLAFLQLVAPIPIISYVDPKSGKDGMFKKWYQMCFKTYISLFIRLLAIYFVAYIVSKLDKMVDIVDGSYVSSLWIKIFVLIGALMFAKQLPKILEGLGIKLDGGFTLNPLKKLEDQALGGKRFTGAAGALTAGTADRFARIATTPGKAGKLKAALGAGPGLLGSAVRGFKSNDGFKGGLNKQASINRRLREGRINGLSPTSSYLDYMGSRFGLDDATLEKESTLIKQNEEAIRRAKAERDEKNRGYVLENEQEKKFQTTRKNTKSDFDNVKKQGDRVLKSAEDLLTKKGNFNTGEHYKAQMEALNRSVAGKETINGMDVGEYYARESRKINERNYKLNRNADAANVQYLTDHNGEKLTSTFMIGDQVFKAGTTIDGNLIAQAQEAQGKYIKTSQKAVTNEMYAMIGDPANLTGEDLDFYNRNITDFEAFKNIDSEFKESIEKTNNSVSAYNNEYEVNISGIDSAPIDGETSYDVIKRIGGDMEAGEGITLINNELARSEAKIQENERKIEKNNKETVVTYKDNNGRVYVDETTGSDKISIEKAESMLKPRAEQNQEKIKQHQSQRSVWQGKS